MFLIDRQRVYREGSTIGKASHYMSLISVRKGYDKNGIEIPHQKEVEGLSQYVLLRFAPLLNPLKTALNAS